MWNTLHSKVNQSASVSTISTWNFSASQPIRHAWCLTLNPIADKIYLDHGGTTLYAKSMLQAITEDLVSNLYGNPHSASTPSALSSKRVEAVRKRVLSFLKADPAKFDVVFVPNTTAAVKLVADSFRDLAASSDTPGNPFWYFYHKDCHTSLVGVREFANAQHRCFHDDSEVERWIDNGGSPNEDPSSSATKLSLFAYPGQSNMTGRRLPLTWYVPKFFNLPIPLMNRH